MAQMNTINPAIVAARYDIHKGLGTDRSIFMRPNGSALSCRPLTVPPRLQRTPPECYHRSKSCRTVSSNALLDGELDELVAKG